MKKSILLMQPEFCMGGVERVLLTLLKNINNEKYNITLLLRNKSVWDDEIPKDIKIKYLFEKNPRNESSFKARFYKYGIMLIPGIMLQKFFKLGQHDIFISFHEPMMYFLKGAKGKKIAWIHTDYEAVNYFPEVNELANKNGVLAKFINRARIKVFHECDKIVCVANSAKKGLIEKTDVQPQKVICKYNLNDEEQIRKLSSEKAPIMEIKGNTIKICSVGRLVDQKAFERFIYIAFNLKKEGYKFEIYIVGDGPHKAKLEKLINKNELNDYITLVGYDRNPYKYISKSKLFVCSSLYEAFCTATTEAIILGIPLVTTDCSGMSELIGDTKAGLIVKNNEKALYYGIKKVLDDEKLYSEMKRAAMLRGQEFERKKLISEIEKLFDE